MSIRFLWWCLIVLLTLGVGSYARNIVSFPAVENPKVWNTRRVLRTYLDDYTGATANNSHEPGGNH